MSKWIGLVSMAVLAVGMTVGIAFYIPESTEVSETPIGSESAPAQRDLSVPLAAVEALGARLEANPDGPVFAVCWAPDANIPVVSSFYQTIHDKGGENWFQMNENWTWSETATDGSGLTRGDPLTVTWSFVPDGTLLDDGSPSFLVQMMDNAYGAGPGGADLTLRPWFTYFQQVFDEWDSFIGINYVYESNDDGQPLPASDGVLGTRGDVRIGSRSIDGSSNTLAFNFFPPFGGDMVLDRDDQGFFANTNNNSRAFRNTLSHEHGHGMGLFHSCPTELTKLMEPSITTLFDGPQHDDILGGNRGYGDYLEFPSHNEFFSTATPLGSPALVDTFGFTNLSIDDDFDVDYFSFTLPADLRIYVTLTPVGFSYLNAAQDGENCPLGTTINTLTNQDLGIRVYGTSGTNVLVSSSGNPAGTPETISNFKLLDGAGTYYVEVFGTQIGVDEAQLYDLQIVIDPGQKPVALCKDLDTCNPNVGSVRFNDGSFDPDPGDEISFFTVPSAPYPPGDTNLLFIVTDGVLSDTCEATVNINQAPIASCINITVPCDSASTSATVVPEDLDDGSLDPDGDSISYALVPPGPYPEGDTNVLFIVSDSRCGGTSDTCSATITVNCSATGVDDPVLNPSLFSVFPNPLRTASTISYSVESPSRVQLDVFDLRGRRVRSLVNREQGAGTYQATWNGTSEDGLRVPAGIYFLQSVTGQARRVQKVVVTP